MTLDSSFSRSDVLYDATAVLVAPDDYHSPSVPSLTT